MRRSDGTKGHTEGLQRSHRWMGPSEGSDRSNLFGVVLVLAFSHPLISSDSESLRSAQVRSVLDLSYILKLCGRGCSYCCV